MTRLSPARTGALTGLLTGLVILGPGLGPGFLLFYDMVFVPQLGFSDRTLGIDGSVPRAVPNDLVVAALSEVLPGDVVQKLLLLAVFLLAGWGVGRFHSSRLAALASAIVATWNPWVAERLAIGHWGFLLGYAALPWVAHAAAAARSGRHRDRAALVLSVTAAALSGSTGAVFALAVATSVLLVPRQGAQRRRGTLAVLAVCGLMSSAAWLVPFLVLAPSSAADPAGVAAFAARADTPLGLWPSLMTGGGIWNTAAWFGDRESVVVAAAATAAVAAVVLYAARTRWWRDHPAYPGITAAGLIGLVLAGASALPGGQQAITWVVVTVPGGGLLRDSQKLTAPWVLALALAAGSALAATRTWVRSKGADRVTATALAAVLAAWPVATLPSLALGGLGRWQAVDYPSEFLQARATIEQGAAGAVAVFPWQLYRRYAWNGNRTTLDPWQRLLTRRVLVNDDLPLSGQTVRGESVDAARVRAASASGADLAGTLRAIGVRYAVVQRDQPPGGFPPPMLGPARAVLDTERLVVFDLGPVPAGLLGRQESASAERVNFVRFSGLGLLVLACVSAVGYSLVSTRRVAERGDLAPAAVES